MKGLAENLIAGLYGLYHQDIESVTNTMYPFKNQKNQKKLNTDWKLAHLFGDSKEDLSMIRFHWLIAEGFCLGVHEACQYIISKVEAQAHKYNEAGTHITQSLLSATYTLHEKEIDATITKVDRDAVFFIKDKGVSHKTPEQIDDDMVTCGYQIGARKAAKIYERILENLISEYKTNIYDETPEEGWGTPEQEQPINDNNTPSPDLTL